MVAARSSRPRRPRRRCRLAGRPCRVRRSTAVRSRQFRGDEVLLLVVGVEAQQERVVDHPLAAFVRRRDRLAVEEHRHALVEAGTPVLWRHLLACRGEPGDVADLVAGADRLALEEAATAEHRVLLAQLGHLAGEGQLVGVGVAQRPVHPGDLGVLAVDVVVALLGAADLVAVRRASACPATASACP